MSGFEYFKKCMTSHYKTFYGRASRLEFWYFVLFTYLLYFIIELISSVINHRMTIELMYILFILIIAVPSLAVTSRRLHDIDKDGEQCLLIFLPVIGVTVIAIWALREGTYGPNNFGDDPYGITFDEADDTDIEDLI